jgi:hypothetical protein
MKKKGDTTKKQKQNTKQATVVVPSCATRATDFDLLIKRGLLLLSFSIPSHCPFSSNILFKYNLYNEIHYLFTGPVKVNFFLLYKR